jgi:hypothetical protein
MTLVSCSSDWGKATASCRGQGRRSPPICFRLHQSPSVAPRSPPQTLSEKKTPVDPCDGDIGICLKQLAYGGAKEKADQQSSWVASRSPPQTFFSSSSSSCEHIEIILKLHFAMPSCRHHYSCNFVILILITVLANLRFTFWQLIYIKGKVTSLDGKLYLSTCTLLSFQSIL